MLSQYDPARHRESAHKFGQDHSVACACYLALGQWHLGFPEQARQYSDRAIEYARSLDHAHTLQFALAYGGAYFAAHCRDADYLDVTTSELRSSARPIRLAHGAPLSLDCSGCS